MSFLSALVFGIISLCLGGICGSLLCVTAGTVFHKPFLKSHFTIVCVLLSIAVAYGAGGFVFIKDLFGQLQLVYSNPVFFGLLFLTGVLCSCFWRLFLPLFIFIYISISVFTGVKLYGKFGSHSDYASVVVNKTGIQVNDKNYYVDDIKNKSIVVEVFTLPGILILPLPRVWYSVIGVVETGYVEKDMDITKSSDFAGNKNNEISSIESSFFWQKQISQFFSWVLSQNQNLFVPVPEGELLPSVYKLNFIVEGEVLTCRLDKSL